MGRSATARAPEGTPMTLEEWAQMDEDEPGELVDGRLEEEEAPTILHEAVVSWIIQALRLWLIPLGGWVFGSEVKFGVAPRRGRKPDVSIYLPGTPVPSRDASLARHPPSALIEVISPRPRDARRDRVDKVRDYARFGVRHHWLVDPLVRTLEIFALTPRSKPTVVLSATSGKHAVPGCAGLRLDLDALWAELDRLPMGALAPPSPPRTRAKPKRSR